MVNLAYNGSPPPISLTRHHRHRELVAAGSDPGDAASHDSQVGRRPLRQRRARSKLPDPITPLFAR
jgi:hypothetical protein